MKRIRSIGVLLLTLVLLLTSFSSVSNAEENNPKKEKLIVGMEAAYPPFNWTQYNDSNGAVKIKDSEEYANGYDVQMAKKIADNLGMELEIVKLEWDGLVPALKSEVINAIIAGMSPTEERRLEVDFTNPYYKSDFVVIVNKNGEYSDAKSLEDFSGANIVAQLNTTNDDAVDQIPGVNHMVPMSDFSSMRVAVQSGKADGYVAEKPEGISAEKAISNLKMVELNPGFEVPSDDTSVSVGVKKGSDLVNQINLSLENISQDEREEIMENMIEIQNLEEEEGNIFSRSLSILKENYNTFIRGTLITLALSLVGTILGLVIGMIIGIIRTIPEQNSKVGNIILKFFKALTTIYVQVLRGTPMMVQATLFYFGLHQISDINLSALTAAFIVVSINTGAYMAEVVRGGIYAIDKGQFEAAKSIGMNHFQTMTEIILPQTFRNIIPNVGNEFIVNIKDTSVLNVIAVNELFFVTKSIAGANFRYFETYLVASFIYLILTLTTAFLLGKLEKRLAGSDSYEISNVMKSAN